MLETLWWIVKLFIVIIIAGTLIGWLYGKTPAWFKTAMSGAASTGVALVRKWIGF